MTNMSLQTYGDNIPVSKCADPLWYTMDRFGLHWSLVQQRRETKMDHVGSKQVTYLDAVHCLPTFATDKGRSGVNASTR